MQLIGKEYSVAELEDMLTLVKGELKGYEPDTDELKIELNDTNRPDLWSPEGIARQLCFKDQPKRYDDLLRLNQSKPEKQVLVDARLQKIRPYIGAFIAKGVPVTEQFLIQMIQTQEKLCDIHGKQRELIAIGIYNAEKIQFPVHYKAIEPHEIQFVPLGCDEKMNLAEILKKHPKGIEFAGILAGNDRYPILYDDRSDVLSFPPVINSRTSGEVTIGDDHLFIEITGMEINMTLHALNIMAYNFNDRGFEIEPVTLVYPYDTEYGREIVSPYPLKNEVELEKALFEKYLGTSYTTEELTTALQNYGLTVQQQDGERLLVSTYPYRLDYMHAVDAVEDLAISMDYNSFEPIMPERFTVGKFAPMTIFEDHVRATMIGFGFEEVILNILTNKEDFSGKVNEMYRDLLQISNVMTETYSCLRNSLIPSLLKVEARSFKSMYPHKVFEVGEVVIRDEAENHGCATKTKLTALFSHAGANFSEMGSCLNHLGYLLFWDTAIQTKHFPIFIEGRSGEIMAGDKNVGIIGEIHPEVLDKWGIKMPTVMFELDLNG